MRMGLYIKHLREQIKLTQEELGKMLDPPVNKAAVNKWETGRVENIKRTHIIQLCISLLTEAGVDERVIQKIVGHKGQNVTQVVYTHLDLPIKLEAINKI